jgi:hypothetical protein
MSSYNADSNTETTSQESVAYPGILFGGEGSANSAEDRGQRERGSGGSGPLVRGSGNSCNLVFRGEFETPKPPPSVRHWREAWFYGGPCEICGELSSNETVFHQIISILCWMLS